MKFKQTFIIIKLRTKSQQNRPVVYTGQVTSYIGEKQNIRNLRNIFGIGGPHSSNSDPLHFLKKKQNNLQKTTSVSSEEQKLKEEIAKLKTKQEKSYAHWDALKEAYKNYQERSLEALQRGDKEMINYYSSWAQRCNSQILAQGRMMDRIYEEIKELNKQLQKLRVKKI